MSHQQNSKDGLRAANTMRALENAQRNLHTGSIGIFMQVTLAVIFMYLIVISYLLLGIAGPVFISVLFLVALFMPFFYQLLKILLEKRRGQKKDPSLEQESAQQG